MKLLLFDIDGTIIDSGEAGTRSLNLAFEELFSIPDGFKDISMAGKTDIQIMKEALYRHGIENDNGHIKALCEAYIRHLRHQIENPRRHIKPFIRESLSFFSNDKGLALGLLTGNIREGAMIKLSPFGLEKYFPFGAFGDDDEERNALLPIAVRRFMSLSGREIDYRDCVVIGDTPRDVECAKVHGAFAIAVATGPYSYDILLKTGADLVLRNISEFIEHYYQTAQDRNL